jgi:hypothetical protein
MGIRDWLSRFQKREDAAAISRAEDATDSDSAQEREVWTGDVEGMAADRDAAEHLGASVEENDGPPAGT